MKEHQEQENVKDSSAVTEILEVINAKGDTGELDKILQDYGSSQEKVEPNSESIQ